MTPELNRVDFRDTHEGPPTSLPLEALVSELLRHPPTWVRTAMRVRDGLVGLVDLKRSRAAPAPTEPKVGDRLGPFEIIAIGPSEILMGLDDRHLDFRVHFRKAAGLVVTTEVELKNALGRAYFLVVKLGHAAVVRSMLRTLPVARPSSA